MITRSADDYAGTDKSRAGDAHDQPSPLHDYLHKRVTRLHLDWGLSRCDMHQGSLGGLFGDKSRLHSNPRIGVRYVEPADRVRKVELKLIRTTELCSVDSRGRLSLHEFWDSLTLPGLRGIEIVIGGMQLRNSRIIMRRRGWNAEESG